MGRLDDSRAGAAKACRLNFRFGQSSSKMRFVVGAVAGAATFAMGAKVYGRRPSMSTDEVTPEWRKYRAVAALRVEGEDYIMRAGRFVANAIGMGLGALILRVQNSCETEGADLLINAIENRPSGTPLLTVCNHSTVVDDPSLFAAMLPARISLRPQLMRWGVCTEDWCFFNGVMASLFGAGKILPIHRGGGVHQSGLLPFARRLQAGEWCHIFPEGRTWQEVGDPMRHPESGLWQSPSGRSPGAAFGSKLGPLKWGVGRIILECERTPMVVPFYHVGMCPVMPHKPNNDLATAWPGVGHKVHVKVGEPVELEDLVHEYRAKERHRYEQEMYQRVTERVEAALLGLEQDMRRKHPEHWHEIRVAVPGGEEGVQEEEGNEVEGVPLGGGPSAPQ